MNQKTTVILNPKSGSSDADFKAEIESELKRNNFDYELRETTPEIGGDVLAEQALQEGAQHIIACGGDGTVMQVVNGLARAQSAASTRSENVGAENARAVLSIVPGGTANLLATALDIPLDVSQAMQIARNGRDRAIDLGRCGKYFFALGIGVGLTERLVSQASTEAKEKIGKLAYAFAMLRELGAKPHRFVLKRDEKIAHRRRGVAIVVANAGEIGGGLKFAPDAKMDDGLLDICILHRFYLRDVVRLLWHSVTGKVREDRAVSFSQAKRIELRSDPPLDVQIDGEVVDLKTPLVIEIAVGALTVRVPIEKEREMEKEKSEVGENPQPLDDGAETGTAHVLG